MWKWNDAGSGALRGSRGAPYHSAVVGLPAAGGNIIASPTSENSDAGFRIAEVRQSQSDIDFDGDVDLHDYDLFLVAFTGAQ